MEIRRLTAEDLLQLYKMHVVVFNMRRNFAKEENPLDDPLAHPAEWSWGVFEKGKLLSGMTEIDFLMRFDGQSVKMSGIGGVGTLPEARKGGLVRQIFEKLLPEAYEKGVVFSSLAPFSHDFYRMFGYEIVCARNNIGISTKNFAKFKPHGEFVQIFPGDNLSELQKVHSAYIANLNHGICRDYWPDNRAWKRFHQDDPYEKGTFLYLWKDEAGVSRSYIKYQDQDDGEEHTMSVSELAFIDKTGLYGAFGLIRGLDSQYGKVRWLMPAFMDPSDFIGDAWNIEQEIRLRDMTRVVNVKTALEIMRKPSGEGAYVVEVEDANIAANSGKYLVEFSPQGTRVSVTQKDPDLRCDIRVLSQLITGYRTLENALFTRQSGLELCGNKETLDRVFTLRPQHLTEFF